VICLSGGPPVRFSAALFVVPPSPALVYPAFSGRVRTARYKARQGADSAKRYTRPPSPPHAALTVRCGARFKAYDAVRYGARHVAHPLTHRKPKPTPFAPSVPYPSAQTTRAHLHFVAPKCTSHNLHTLHYNTHHPATECHSMYPHSTSPLPPCLPFQTLLHFATPCCTLTHINASCCTRMYPDTRCYTRYAFKRT